MPHPVRDNQTTTTSPHQPSPPHPTPAGDPPGRPTSPPQQAPHPPLAAKRGRSWRAGRPGAQPTLAGWRTGPPPPAHNSRLPPAAPNGCRQQGQGLFAALGCSSAPSRHPLPPCAQLTGGARAAGGSGWRSRPPGRPAAGRVGRGLPAPGLAGAFGPPTATAAFLRLFQPFRRRFALVQLRLSGLRVLWFDQAWPN